MFHVVVKLNIWLIQFSVYILMVEISYALDK